MYLTVYMNVIRNVIKSILLRASSANTRLFVVVEEAEAGCIYSFWVALVIIAFLCICDEALSCGLAKIRG